MSQDIEEQFLDKIKKSPFRRDLRYDDYAMQFVLAHFLDKQKIIGDYFEKHDIMMENIICFCDAPAMYTNLF